jgi:hypothetical protein
MTTLEGQSSQYLMIFCTLSKQVEKEKNNKWYILETDTKVKKHFSLGTRSVNFTISKFKKEHYLQSL